MSGLPAVPAFRHPPAAPDVVVGKASTGAMSSGVMTADTAEAPVGVDEAVDVPTTPGPWGCNAVADCADVAVVQWAAPAPTDDDPLCTVPVFACADHDGVA